MLKLKLNQKFIIIINDMFGYNHYDSSDEFQITPTLLMNER